MSRRDTIIVAVLINTGLLAALFMMAIHTESPIEIISQDVIAEATISQPPQPFKEEIKMEEVKTLEEPKVKTYVATRDEIDEVLKSYNRTNQQPVTITTESRQETTNEQRKPSPKLEVEKISKEGFVEVKVKKGDFLEKIAKANGVSVNAIMRANQMTSARIDVGQVLKIPIEKSKEISSASSQPKPVRKVASGDPEYYTIKSGDNPWKIARQFHVKFEDLLKLNDLDESKARNLKPGDVLRVK